MNRLFLMMKHSSCFMKRLTSQSSKTTASQKHSSNMTKTQKYSLLSCVSIYVLKYTVGIKKSAYPCTFVFDVRMYLNKTILDIFNLYCNAEHQGPVLRTLLTQLAGFACCRFHLILDHLVLRSSSRSCCHSNRSVSLTLLGSRLISCKQN